MDALRCLPGVGPKSAQRMALHLLQRDRDGAQTLANSLIDALEGIGHCQSCRLLCEEDYCSFCQNSQRDRSQICVVENLADVYAIENTNGYKGLYFVLMGHLSPLDGIGPDQLGLTLLDQRLDEGQIKEVIIATNPTVEGEATAHFINDMVCRYDGIVASRIAHGVPLGGELEYLNGETLSHAFAGRRKF